jgi:NAD(P)-dependent dehydrogenase (short-subunit alcohol dehydrogenase family)
MGVTSMSVTEDTAQKPLAHVRDRVAMVTGGTAGIGAAICRLLAEEGASIAAGYSRDTPRAEKYLQTMSGAYPGRRVTFHQGNIGLADDCRRVAQEVIDQHGRLDILVNNAGITIDRTVTKMTDREGTVAWQTAQVLDIVSTYTRGGQSK